MIISLLTNLNFWSAIFGLSGSILIFFFGLPPKIDPEGQCYIITGQIDEKEVKKGKIYKIISRIGITFISVSFLLQLIYIVSR